MEDNSSQGHYTEEWGSDDEVQPCNDIDVLPLKNDVHSHSNHVSHKSNSKQFHHVNKAKYTDSKTVSLHNSKHKETVTDSALSSEIPVESLSLCNNDNNYNIPQTFTDKTYKHVTKEENSQDFVDQEQILLYVWKNKHLSKEHAASLAQNGGDFGYIPLIDFLIYDGPHVFWEKVTDILEAHQIIRDSGVPNFLKDRIPVVIQLNPDRWSFHLQDYWDKQLPGLIKDRFPLDFDRKSELEPTYDNHASANQYVDQLDHYLTEELKYGAIYGPFKQLPFPVHISPLMTRPKQNSDKHCTIMDISWPKGASINNAIHKFKYLDTYFSLSYPSIDHIVQQVKQLGPGSLLYKVDISRSFCHLLIDPGDIDLLGLLHKDLFLDGSPPFGFRLGSGFF